MFAHYLCLLVRWFKTKSRVVFSAKDAPSRILLVGGGGHSLSLSPLPLSHDCSRVTAKVTWLHTKTVAPDWIGCFYGGEPPLTRLTAGTVIKESLTARLQKTEPALCAFAKLQLYYPSYKWKVQEMTHACRWRQAYVWNWSGLGQQKSLF